MTFWVITDILQQQQADNAAIYYPSGGLPDLSRALSRDHLREWVKHVQGDVLPDAVDDETNRLWKVFYELHREDYIIVCKDSETFSFGEIMDSYRFERGDDGGKHLWPVRWIALDIPLLDYPTLRPMLLTRSMKELPAEDVRIALRKYLPSLRTKSYLLFRWMSIAILIAELVYFWPHANK